jgi:CheY-like chemotaxis protein
VVLVTLRSLSQQENQMNPKLHFRLLLIEDNPDRVELFRSWIPPGVHIVRARSGGSAIGIIRRDVGRVYGGILLDHDLQEQTITAADVRLSGSNVVLELINHFSRDIPILVHSTNQIQGPQMVNKLERAGFWVSHVPMYNLEEKNFAEWLQEARELWEDQYP